MFKKKIVDKQNKKVIIAGLLAVVLLMAVGYAAFQTVLTINGTGSIDSNWCVGFDSTKTNTYQITKGLSTGTSPSASMSYDGNVCQASYKTNANLNSTFHQPGDQIVYTLTIANKGTINAAIESILVDNQSVTSNTTINKGNITYIVEMPETTSLAANTGTTTMKVTAKFQNTTDISSYTTAETQTINVQINAAQDDGTNAMDVTPAEQYVYAWNTNTVTVGTSQLSDLQSTKTSQPYYTSASDVMNASGYTLFNKYTVENDTITEGYTCQTFGISGLEPVCLQGGDSSYYNYNNSPGNWSKLNTLNSNSTFTGASGSCIMGSGDSSCGVGGLVLAAYSDGYVSAYDDVSGPECIVFDTGSAYCSAR